MNDCTLNQTASSISSLIQSIIRQDRTHPITRQDYDDPFSLKSKIKIPPGCPQSPRDNRIRLRKCFICEEEMLPCQVVTEFALCPHQVHRECSPRPQCCLCQP